MKKTILILTRQYGGFGDYLFALKLANVLRKHYEAEGNDQAIYVVTENEGKTKIQELNVDTEFDVTVLNPKDLEEKIVQEELDISVMIAGPGKSLDLLKLINPIFEKTSQKPIPLFSVNEYGHEKRTFQLDKNYANSVVYETNNHVTSGFSVSKNEKGVNDGILITEELNDLHHLKDLDQRLDPHVASPLLGSKQFEAYQQTTDLYFQYYSNFVYPFDNRIKSNKNNLNASEHFFRIHQSYIKQDPNSLKKNQDILQVGGVGRGAGGLEKIKEELIQDGFTSIHFYNLDVPINNYECCLNTNSTFDENKVYFQINAEGLLEYTVLYYHNASYTEKITEVITPNELHYSFKKPLSVEQLKPFFPEILNVLSKKNHVKIRDTVIYESNSETSGRTYRVLYTKQMTHRSMIACIALANFLMGATGDQSFSEVLSANKFPIYETYSHKEELIKGFETVLGEQDSRFITLFKRLLQDLEKAEQRNNYQEIGRLLHELKESFQTINQSLLKEGNLAKKIAEEVLKNIRLSMYIAGEELIPPAQPQEFPTSKFIDETLFEHLVYRNHYDLINSTLEEMSPREEKIMTQILKNKNLLDQTVFSRLKNNINKISQLAFERARSLVLFDQINNIDSRNFIWEEKELLALLSDSIRTIYTIQDKNQKELLIGCLLSFYEKSPVYKIPEASGGFSLFSMFKPSKTACPLKLDLKELFKLFDANPESLSKDQKSYYEKQYNTAIEQSKMAQP